MTDARELADECSEAAKRLHHLCGTRADAPSWADIAMILRERERLLAALAPMPVERERIALDSNAPEPCSDLSVGELIEWLDSPQYTNGFLDFEAANHMSAAAELIEKLLTLSHQPEGGGGK